MRQHPESVPKERKISITEYKEKMKQLKARLMDNGIVRPSKTLTSMVGIPSLQTTSFRPVQGKHPSEGAINQATH